MDVFCLRFRATRILRRVTPRAFYVGEIFMWCCQSWPPRPVILRDVPVCWGPLSATSCVTGHCCGRCRHHLVCLHAFFGEVLQGAPLSHGVLFLCRWHPPKNSCRSSPDRILRVRLRSCVPFCQTFDVGVFSSQLPRPRFPAYESRFFTAKSERKLTEQTDRAGVEAVGGL